LTLGLPGDFCLLRQFGSHLKDYEKSDPQEVLLGEFDAANIKKYTNPKTFLHALWNTAVPLVGAMVTCLGIIKNKLDGQTVEVLAKFNNLLGRLINFLHKEAGEDPYNV
jgi:hypothetical protein